MSLVDLNPWPLLPLLGGKLGWVAHRAALLTLPPELGQEAAVMAGTSEAEAPLRLEELVSA